MTTPWSAKPGEAKGGPEQESELSLIPAWSVALAVVVFAAVQYLFHHVLPHGRAEMLPMRLLTSYSWGTALASYALLIGYVSRDVKRRNMSAPLWMLIVVVMPGGIGAIVYFLLRQPVLLRCALTARPRSPRRFNFCPQCQFQMAPVCGTLLSRSAHDRRLLCAVRTRPGRGPSSGEASRV